MMRSLKFLSKGEQVTKTHEELAALLGNRIREGDAPKTAVSPEQFLFDFNCGWLTPSSNLEAGIRTDTKTFHHCSFFLRTFLSPPFCILRFFFNSAVFTCTRSCAASLRKKTSMMKLKRSSGPHTMTATKTPWPSK